MTVVNARFLVRRVAAALALSALVAVLLPVATAQAATTYSISGTVSLPVGAPSEWLRAVWVSASAVDGESGFGQVPVNHTTGAYTITGLGSGDYVIRFKVSTYMETFWAEPEHPNMLGEYYVDSPDLEGSTKVEIRSANVPNVNATLEFGKTISGKVTLPATEDTQAFYGVEVTASSPTGEVLRTAKAYMSTGEYTLVGLQPGSYQVTFDPGDYFDRDTGAWVRPNLAAEVYNNAHTGANATLVNVTSSDATAINATLEAGLTISGKVTLPAGSPKEWYDAIEVSATMPDSVGQYLYTPVDPETGNYSINGLAPGQYTVAFDVRHYRDEVLDAWLAPNLMDEYYPNSRSSAGATKVKLAAGGASGINVTLDRGAMLSGTVSGMGPDVGHRTCRWRVTTASGELVLDAGVETWVNVAATSTPAENSFALGALEPGSYRIVLSQCPGNSQGQQYLFTAAGESLFTVTRGQTLSGLEFALRPATATVSGTLTVSGFSGYSKGSGEPDYLADVVLYEKLGTSWVRYPDPAHRAHANGVTAYTIPGLAAGTYTVGFEKSQTPYTKNGATVEQWFNGKTSLATASAFTLTAGQAKTGVNGAVAPGSPLTYTTVPTPTVAGTATVGNKLTVGLGMWSPKPDSYGYQWYRDGVAIAGATYSQYLVKVADAGHQVSVVVTGLKPGYTKSSKGSARVSVPLLTYTTVPTPTVTGTAAVGNKLTVAFGTWSPQPDSYAYQWYRDGVAISGATYSQYLVASPDAGHQLSVVVTGKKTGYTKTAEGSARVNVPVPLTYTTVGMPTISGTAVVGNKLTVGLGTWSPKPDSYGYQWYRDGVAIAGATYSQYRLTTADAGHQVSVVVTGKKSGYTRTAKGSARTTIASE